MSAGEQAWIDRCVDGYRGSISALAAGVAHELGNAVLALRGASTRGHDDTSTARTADRVAELATALRLLAAGVEESGGRSVDVGVWWSETTPLARCILGSQIVLEGAVPGDLARVRIAPGALTHAALHLLRNAAESNAGRVRLEAVGDADRVALAIEDDGDGMTPEVLGRCREASFSTRGAAGLGLPLAERLIARAGGEIVIESAAGHGTRVVVILPTASPEAALAANTPVLVKIADPRLRAMIAHELGRWSCAIRSQPAGDEVVRIVDRVEDGHVGPTVFIGPAADTPPGWIVLEPRPKLSELREALLQAARRVRSVSGT